MTTITRLIASPKGDLPYEPSSDARVPLEGCPAGASYGDYFDGIDRYLTSGGLDRLLETLGGLDRTDLACLRIRAEKHGALYHPASLETQTADGRTRRYVLAVATWERGRLALAHECDSLSRLQQERPCPDIPLPLHFQDDGRMAFLLADWFEDFHELHVTADGRLNLWDYTRGPRDIPEDRRGDVYARAASILVRTYDFPTGERIWPWHHAAGDFIVRLDGRNLEVRLTTVRDYAPWSGLDDDEADPVTMLFYFFLETTLRMRLDRVDGTQAPVWLDESCLRGAVDGFLSALADRPDSPLTPQALAGLVRSLDPEDLTLACVRVAGTFPGEDGRLAGEKAPAHAVWLQTLCAIPG